MNVWDAILPHKPNILSTFLGKITRNLSFNRYKMNRADKRGGSEIPAILDELTDCVSGNNNIEREIEYKELIEAINDFLVTLSHEKRGIFICRYWYSESISNIAKEYGMKENAVSMMLSRLRLKLHEYLIERGVEL